MNFRIGIRRCFRAIFRFRKYFEIFFRGALHDPLLQGVRRHRLSGMNLRLMAEADRVSDPYSPLPRRDLGPGNPGRGVCAPPRGGSIRFRSPCLRTVRGRHAPPSFRRCAYGNARGSAACSGPRSSSPGSRISGATKRPAFRALADDFVLHRMMSASGVASAPSGNSKPLFGDICGVLRLGSWPALNFQLRVSRDLLGLRNARTARGTPTVALSARI